MVARPRSAEYMGYPHTHTFCCPGEPSRTAPDKIFGLNPRPHPGWAGAAHVQNLCNRRMRLQRIGPSTSRLPIYYYTHGCLGRTYPKVHLTQTMCRVLTHARTPRASIVFTSRSRLIPMCEPWSRIRHFCCGQTPRAPGRWRREVALTMFVCVCARVRDISGQQVVQRYTH